MVGLVELLGVLLSFVLVRFAVVFSLEGRGELIDCLFGSLGLLVQLLQLLVQLSGCSGVQHR